MSSFTDATLSLLPGEKRGAWRWWLFRLPGRQLYGADHAFRFYIGNPDFGCGVEIPTGFTTDMASIPAIVLWILPRHLRNWIAEQLAKPSIVHDRMRDDLQFNLIDADALFLVAMKAAKVNPLLREIAFLCVRANSSRGRGL